jgi:hypothetical protein
LVFLKSINFLWVLLTNHEKVFTSVFQSYKTRHPPPPAKSSGGLFFRRQTDKKAVLYCPFRLRIRRKF